MPERDESWSLGSVILLSVVIGMLAWAARIAWSEHSLRAEIAALPRAERTLLYHQTLEQMRTVCSHPPDLRDHCIHQAMLALQLAECDAECRALASTVLAPHRR